MRKRVGENRSALAQKVLNWRLALDWSQRDLAREAGLSHAWVGQFEGGEIDDPHITTLSKLARCFWFASPNALLEASGNNPPPRAVPGAAPPNQQSGSAAPPVVDAEVPTDPGPQMAAFVYPDREPRRTAPVYGRIPASPPGTSEVDEKPLYNYPVPDELAEESRLLGIVVKGNSLANVKAFGGIRSGDIVWVRWGRTGVQLEDVVAAKVKTRAGKWEHVLKLFTKAKGIEGLWSQDEQGREVLTAADEYDITGKVLAVETPRRVRTAGR